MSEIDQIYRALGDDTELDDQDKPASEIQKFYAGRTVLLTGATGFIGKCVLEKLLRGCPDIRRIFVLVRGRGSMTPAQNIARVLQNPIFNRLKKHSPDFIKKIVLIPGDLTHENLGIDMENRLRLINEVNIMIHNGATTRFDEVIETSLRINVLATRAMLDLALECRHMVSFVYVSTAYSHCYQQHIAEQFYPAPMDMPTVLDMMTADRFVQGLDEKTIGRVLGNWPNVYAFTKALAEDLVREYGERADFSCSVYRPSIVIGTYREPYSGWIGNMNGPNLIFLGAGLGLVHVSPSSGNLPLDLVPSDYVANSLIAIVRDQFEHWKIEKKPRVYNFGSTTTSPIRPRVMQQIFMEEINEIGCVKMIWYPFLIFAYNKWLFLILHIFFHMLPAVFADLAFIIQKRKAKALSVCWKATRNVDKIAYFANGDWKIQADASMRCYDALNETDRKMFDFDIRSIDWQEYFRYSIRAQRIDYVRDPLDNVVEGRRKLQRLKLAHYAFTTIVISGLIYGFMIALSSWF